MSNTDDEPRQCTECNKLIPPARVKAMPGTWICVECSEELGGEFVLVAKQENLAKEKSLKKNYGSVTVTRKRRQLPAR